MVLQISQWAQFLRNSILKLNLKIKVLFLDLGNTLVSRPKNSEKFVAFPETVTLLNKLKEKGIEMAIISDGNRLDLNEFLADPTILNRFSVVVMSDDDEYWYCARWNMENN